MWKAQLAVLWALSGALVAQNFSFVIGPPIIDGGNERGELPAGCVPRVQETINTTLKSALAGRIFEPSIEKMIGEDDRVLVLYPSINVLRDFQEVAAGTIINHSVVLSGQLEIVDPRTSLSFGSIPRLVEAAQQIGISKSAQQDSLVTAACEQVANVWAQEVAVRVAGTKLARIGPVQVIPLPGSFAGKRGGVLLAGKKNNLKPKSTFKGTRGDTYRIFDLQDTFSLVEFLDRPEEKLQRLDAATINVAIDQAEERDSKPNIVIDADPLMALLTKLEPEFPLASSQIASMFAAYLAKPQTVEVVMGSSVDPANKDYSDFEEKLSSLTKDSSGNGKLSLGRRARVVLEAQNPDNLRAVLRLATYKRTSTPQPDGVVLHQFQLGISCDLIEPNGNSGTRQLYTAFNAEIRRRFEKPGVRDIDNNMTLAFLARSVLTNVAADLEKYISGEYIPKVLRSSQSVSVTVADPKNLQWGTPKPPALKPVEVYRDAKLSVSDQQKLGTPTALASEKFLTTNLNDLSRGVGEISKGDRLVYSANSNQSLEIAVKVDLPKQLGPDTWIGSALAGSVQALLNKQGRIPVYPRFPATQDWPSITTPSANVIVNAVSAQMQPAGCVGTIQVITWVGASAADVGTRDKTKLYYRGVQFVGEPIPTKDEAACLAGAVVQYLPQYQSSLDAVALAKQIGN